MTAGPVAVPAAAARGAPSATAAPAAPERVAAPASACGRGGPAPTAACPGWARLGTATGPAGAGSSTNCESKPVRYCDSAPHPRPASPPSGAGRGQATVSAHCGPCPPKRPVHDCSLCCTPIKRGFLTRTRLTRPARGRGRTAVVFRRFLTVRNVCCVCTHSSRGDMESIFGVSCAVKADCSIPCVGAGKAPRDRVPGFRQHGNTPVGPLV